MFKRKGMFIIRKKPLQLVFIFSLCVVFIFFISILFVSDQPKSPIPKKELSVGIDVKPSDKIILEGEYLFEITILENESYSTIFNKVTELKAKIIYFNRDENRFIVSFTKEFEVDNLLVKLKRKFLDSSVKHIDKFNPTGDNLEEMTSVVNTTIFYNPEKNFMFSMPLQWTSKIVDNSYHFSNEDGIILLKINRFEKNNQTVDKFLETHILSMSKEGFVLDGNIDKTITEGDLTHYKWTLTNNDISIPQGVIESDNEFYFFESQKVLSSEHFLLSFDTVQIY
jgi:hypothetical protein